MSISRIDDGLFVDVNESFASLLGQTRDELLGQTAFAAGAWVDPAERARLVQILRERSRFANEEVAQ
jgi:PAS domain S-box-containing protein